MNYRWQFPDGQVIMLDRPFSRHGVNYPENWLRLSSAEDREAWGLSEVPEPPAPPMPPPPIPRIVTPLQARVALNHFGLLQNVETAVAAHPDATVRIAWEYATEINRDSALLIALASALGITEAQLDDIFTFAAGVTV